MMTVQHLFYGYSLAIVVFICSSSQADWTKRSANLDQLLKDQLGLNEKETISTLHTLKNLTFWAAKEEDIVQVLNARLQNLNHEANLIQSYLVDYKETSEEAFKNLHQPRQTSLERGEVIASHIILGHRMVCRYNAFIGKLRNLLQSPEYNENIKHVSQVLELGHETLNNSKVTIPEEANPEEAISPEENVPVNSSFSKVNFPEEYDDPEFTKLIQKNSMPAPPGYLVWPNWVDKYFSMLSILHIQHVYGVNANQLRIGLIIDSSFGGELTALNCYDIGAFALYRSYYYCAIDWLEEAKRLVLQANDPSLNLDAVSDLLTKAIQEHNNRMRDGTKFADFFFMDYTYEGDQSRKRYLKDMYEKMGKFDDPHPLAQYVGLCSGITFQTPAMQKDLKCFYANHHPYLYINPLKGEKLSESPHIVQFYEMLGNKTIDKIKAVGEPLLRPSALVGTYGLDEVTEHRTSVGAFLKYHEIPELYKFAEIATNLRISRLPELAQFVEYTYGRQYVHHSDALESEEETMSDVQQFGDRMATLLYIIENPGGGGKTPFCSAGIYGHQVRGSAILWYSLYRNGTVRQDVQHGACPVVHGHKMVINHWIRYKANFRNFPCSLNQFE